jgi:hypothetical protein
MQKIIQQLADQVGTKVEHIHSVKIDEEIHVVDFKENDVSYWAKLHKSNKAVKKNSVLRSRY